MWSADGRNPVQNPMEVRSATTAFAEESATTAFAEKSPLSRLSHRFRGEATAIAALVHNQPPTLFVRYSCISREHIVLSRKGCDIRYRWGPSDGDISCFFPVRLCVVTRRRDLQVCLNFQAPSDSKFRGKCFPQVWQRQRLESAGAAILTLYYAHVLCLPKPRNPCHLDRLEGRRSDIL